LQILYNKAKLNKNKQEDIAIIKGVFNKYIKDKIFNPNAVQFKSNFDDRICKLLYIDNGVEINYYSRMALYLGDYDLFLDLSVYNDGECIIDKKFI
jgi:hypothetical protein